MKKLLSQQGSNSSDDSDELARLHLACREWGFFQLVNHGVSSSLMEKIKTEIQDFFNLPIKEKKRFWQQPGDVEGFGQAFVVSDEQKLDWADLFFMTTLPVQMRKPRLFPELPTPFKSPSQEGWDLVPVKPLPDAFIVNIGDILEIQTNGTYRSIEHRAILITEQTPAAYTRIGVQEYFKAFFARKLQGKSFLDDLRI
ncbi:hypothetical protein M0R45_014513 [Rubus argutus]|uniref:Uncharacterized protein n=1 Tax=Rubus argutus TaxID=59490 RepID=A0AAW1XLH4_RUBAR